MGRHLTRSQLETALRRGASVEQFLGGDGPSEARTIAWLTIRASRAPQGGFELALSEAVDSGSEDWLDVYSFASSRAGEEWPGARSPIEWVLDADRAVLDAQALFGAQPDRWVNEGVVQDEYLDYLRDGRPDRPDALHWQLQRPARSWQEARDRMEPYVEAVFWQDLGLSHAEGRKYVDWVLDRIVRPEFEKLIPTED